MMDLNEVAAKNYQNAKARGYKVDSVLSDLKDAAGEIVEAAAACSSWLEFSDSDIVGEKYEWLFQLEVADVIMCMLTISHAMKWDIEDILQKCLDKNEERIKGGE